MTFLRVSLPFSLDPTLTYPFLVAGIVYGWLDWSVPLTIESISFEGVAGIFLDDITIWELKD